MATLKDVAQLAGVSVATVSRVFNEAPNVRPATREKVFEIAGDLDYHPNLSARRLASKRTFLTFIIKRPSTLRPMGPASATNLR